MRGDPLAHNIAEVIDDLYREHSPPRDHDYMIALIQHQIEHVQWITAKPLREEIERLRALETTRPAGRGRADLHHKDDEQRNLPGGDSRPNHTGKG